MKEFQVSFICLALLIYYANVGIEVVDGTLFEDGYHYKKSHSNSNLNNYSQSNEENEELEGVLNGRTFKGEKKSGYTTSGASHAHSSSFASSSFNGNVPASIASTSAFGNANAGAQSHVGFGAAIKPGTENFNINNAHSNNIGILSQSSGKPGSPLSQLYWWMGDNSPFKPQGGCNSNGCSISGVFSNNNDGEGISAVIVNGSFTGSTAAAQYGAIHNKNNPFLNVLHGKYENSNANDAISTSGGHFGGGFHNSGLNNENQDKSIAISGAQATAQEHGIHGKYGSHFSSESQVDKENKGVAPNIFHGGIHHDGNIGVSSHGGFHKGITGHFDATTPSGFGIHGDGTPSSHGGFIAGTGASGSSFAFGAIHHGGHTGIDSHTGLQSTINGQDKPTSQSGLHAGTISSNPGGYFTETSTQVIPQHHGTHDKLGSHFGSESNFGTKTQGPVITHGGINHDGHFGISSHTGLYGGHSGKVGTQVDSTTQSVFGDRTSHVTSSNGGFITGPQIGHVTNGGFKSHFSSGAHVDSVKDTPGSINTHGGSNHGGNFGTSYHNGFNVGVNKQTNSQVGSTTPSGVGLVASDLSQSQPGFNTESTEVIKHGHRNHEGHINVETGGSGSDSAHGVFNHGGHIGISSHGGFRKGINKQVDTTTQSGFGIHGDVTPSNHGGFISGNAMYGIHGGHGNYFNSESHFGTGVTGDGITHGGVNHGGQIGIASNSELHSSVNGLVESTTQTGFTEQTDGVSSSHGGFIAGNGAQANSNNPGIHGGHGSYFSSESHFGAGVAGDGVTHGGIHHGGHIGVGSHSGFHGGVNGQIEFTTERGFVKKPDDTSSSHGGFIFGIGAKVPSIGHSMHGGFGSHYNSNSHGFTVSGSVDLGANHGENVHNEQLSGNGESDVDLNASIGTVEESIHQSGIGSQFATGSSGESGIHNGASGFNVAQGEHVGYNGAPSSSQNGITTATGLQGNDQINGGHEGHFNFSSSHNTVTNVNGGNEGQDIIEQSNGYSQPQKPQTPFITGYTINCNGTGKICVTKDQCINGYVSLVRISSVFQKSQTCDVTREVCCNLKQVSPDSSGTNIPNHAVSVDQGGSAPGGLFGSGGESDGDLSAGDNSGSAGESNGYLPPLGSSSSSNVPAFSQPPQKPQDLIHDNSPSNNQQQFEFPPVQPQVGCAAALICVEERFCNMIGTISETPVALTSEQLLRRVPLVDCKNPDNGVIGKCCRDPNYVDPWPAGNLPANYSGGFDDQGFPTFLNLSKNKPKKPVKPVQSFQQPLHPIRQQPTKIVPQQPQSFPSINSISSPLQPQSSFQTTKITPNQFKPFQQNQNVPQQPRPFQTQQPQKSGHQHFNQPQQSVQQQFIQPQQPNKIQQSKYPQQPQQPEQPQQFHQFQFQKPQQPQQSEKAEHFQFQQPQQPDQSQHSLPSESEQPQQPIDQPVKFGQPTLPEKTFNFPSLPAFQEIPNQITNQISNLNPFKPQKPIEQPQVSDIINGGGDVLGVNVPTSTNRPGIFQNFPNLPSFPGFGKGHDSSPTNESPVIIAPHKPGSQCGIINQVQQPGVLGDSDVAFGEIPWQAMILSNTEKKLLCSGVIIAPNLILTAANCVYGLNPSEVSIKAGEWKLGYDLKHEEPLPFEIVQVDSIVPHPNYQSGSPSFDIAMLFLQSPIKLDLHVDTICIGDAPAITPQRKCISTGWGKTILQIHAAGALMHKIEVDVLSNDQCSHRLQGAESSIDIDDSLVCAKAHKQNNNMCQVDIGGPLACDRGDGNYELIGVYNQDTGCLPTNQVATFALIDTKWVKSMIESPTAPPTQAIYGNKATPIEHRQTPSRVHYHPNQPDVPCDCQQGTLPSGANQYLPPV